MASFTDQLPRIATEGDIKAPWNGRRDGSCFRCYLCGHTFIVGDQWRWVSGSTVHLWNFLVCALCDETNNNIVLEKWQSANLELKERFWWATRL